MPRMCINIEYQTVPVVLIGNNKALIETSERYEYQ